MFLKGKVALVTGGAGGIGFRCVRKLLNEGVTVCGILDIDSEVGNSRLNEINAEFGQNRAIFFPCDVSKESSFENAVKTIIGSHGSLDIIVNNAGIVRESDETWEAAIQTNLIGTINGTKLALKYMGKENGGKGGYVINIASILGLVPSSWCPIYSCTKHAIIGYTRSLGSPLHLKRNGVKIMALCPGPILTTLLKKDNDYLGADMKSEMEEMVVHHGLPQDVSTVANALMEVLKHGDNGSVWVVEAGLPAYELDIPDYKEIPKKKK